MKPQPDPLASLTPQERDLYFNGQAGDPARERVLDKAEQLYANAAGDVDEEPEEALEARRRAAREACHASLEQAFGGPEGAAAVLEAAQATHRAIPSETARNRLLDAGNDPGVITALAQPDVARHLTSPAAAAARLRQIETDPELSRRYLAGDAALVAETNALLAVTHGTEPHDMAPKIFGPGGTPIKIRITR